MAAPDRALRRQIALLEELQETDRLAVLGMLDDDAREDVLTLLAGTKVEARPQVEPAKVEQQTLPEGLSGWLRARLGQAVETGVGETFAITEHCLAQLRNCVAEMVPQPPRKTSWIRRLIGDRQVAPVSAARPQ